MVFGHLEVIHSKFHDPTISNLGDQSVQTNTQTNKQTYIVIDIVDLYHVWSDRSKVTNRVTCLWPLTSLSYCLTKYEGYLNHKYVIQHMVSSVIGFRIRYNKWGLRQIWAMYHQIFESIFSSNTFVSYFGHSLCSQNRFLWGIQLSDIRMKQKYKMTHS